MQNGQWKVTLVRQPFMENVTYPCRDKASAQQRAYSLAELHRCNASVINASHRIWVHASTYYSKVHGEQQ